MSLDVIVPILSSSAVTAAAMEKSTSLDGTIERGSRESSSDEDGSSVNVSDERRTPPMPSNSATPTKEGALLNMQVSDFQMVCVLGIGSRGKVLLAHHKSSSNLYALKVIAKRRVLASHDVQRTLTEQAVLSRMAIDGTTQFMAKLRRSFHDEDNLYLAMVRLVYMYMLLLLSFGTNLSVARTFILVATFGLSWTAGAALTMNVPASMPQKSLTVLRACIHWVSSIVTSSRNTFSLIRVAT